MSDDGILNIIDDLIVYVVDVFDHVHEMGTGKLTGESWVILKEGMETLDYSESKWVLYTTEMMPSDFQRVVVYYKAQVIVDIGKDVIFQCPV